MPLSKPFRRLYRPMLDRGRLDLFGEQRYLHDARFANSASSYTRAFLLLLEDTKKLFDYVEPSDVNLKCFSYRIHELLLRACIEIEANFKAIFRENICDRPSGPYADWNIRHYRKIEISHRLSEFMVKLPLWHGGEKIIRPFEAFSLKATPPWYRAYNDTKHDRHSQFESSSLENMLGAVTGLLVVLSSQFFIHSFLPDAGGLVAGRDSEGFIIGLGDYFKVFFPKEWNTNDVYQFDWEPLKGLADPFERFDYNAVT